MQVILSELTLFVENVQLASPINRQPNHVFQFVEQMKFITHRQASVNVQVVSQWFKESVVFVMLIKSMNQQFNNVFQFVEWTKFTHCQKKNASVRRTFTWLREFVANVRTIKYILQRLKLVSQTVNTMKFITIFWRNVSVSLECMWSMIFVDLAKAQLAISMILQSRSVFGFVQLIKFSLAINAFVKGVTTRSMVSAENVQ